MILIYERTNEDFADNWNKHVFTNKSGTRNYFICSLDNPKMIVGKQYNIDLRKVGHTRFPWIKGTYKNYPFYDIEKLKPLLRKENNMKKTETKTEQMVCYQQIWEAHYIAPSYLDELLKGAIEQHRNLVEYSNIDNLGIAYILANGDRFVKAQITDKKHPENSYNNYVYQRKVK